MVRRLDRISKQLGPIPGLPGDCIIWRSQHSNQALVLAARCQTNHTCRCKGASRSAAVRKHTSSRRCPAARSISATALSINAPGSMGTAPAPKMLFTTCPKPAPRNASRTEKPIYLYTYIDARHCGRGGQRVELPAITADAGGSTPHHVGAGGGVIEAGHLRPEQFRIRTQSLDFYSAGGGEVSLGGGVVGEIRMREIVQPCKQCMAETLKLARELQKALLQCTLIWRLALQQPGSFAWTRRFCQGRQEWCKYAHNKGQGGRWHAQHGSPATSRVLQNMHATHVC